MILGFVENRIFVGYLAYFCGLCAYFCVFFAYILFLVWSIWGSTHCNVYNTTEKVACIFVIRGRSVGPCLNSGADEQQQYILCVHMQQKVAKHVGVSNSWNRIYWPDTQRSPTGNLDYGCLNDNQKFLRHLISERLIQMCQSGMFTRFAHCLRLAFKVPTGHFFLVFLKVQAGNFEQFIAHIFSPTVFFIICKGVPSVVAWKTWKTCGSKSLSPYNIDIILFYIYVICHYFFMIFHLWH